MRHPGGRSEQRNLLLSVRMNPMIQGAEGIIDMLAQALAQGGEYVR
jgi:hypothetical protein